MYYPHLAFLHRPNILDRLHTLSTLFTKRWSRAKKCLIPWRLWDKPVFGQFIPNQFSLRKNFNMGFDEHFFITLNHFVCMSKALFTCNMCLKSTLSSTPLEFPIILCISIDNQICYKSCSLVLSFTMFIIFGTILVLIKWYHGPITQWQI